MDTTISYIALLKFAKQVARQAGDVIATSALTSAQIFPKGEHDFVTEADLTSQDLIVDLIRSKYPHHGFLVEESSPTVPPPKQYTWVVDPIDGTVNYIRERPLFCVSLGLLIDGTPSVGVIYDPIRKEMFSAASGQGFEVNDKPPRTKARTARLYDAAVATDWEISSALRTQATELIGRLIPNIQTVPIIGSVALAMAWIASGRLDAYFKYNAKTWDIAAAAVMLAETGGAADSSQ